MVNSSHGPNAAAQLSRDKTPENNSKIYCAAIKFKCYGSQPTSEMLSSRVLISQYPREMGECDDLPK